MVTRNDEAHIVVTGKGTMGHTVVTGKRESHIVVTGKGMMRHT